MLKKSTFREIRTSLARYLAIFAIVALGVGFFSGLKDCKESMVSTARRYLDTNKFYDYQILSSYGADDDSVAEAEAWDGVSAAEGSIQIDVIARSGSGDSRALKAISLPENLNTLNVTEGRLPQNADECVVDAYSITDEGFHIGDHIEITDENDKDKLKDFNVKDFEIVGLVNTPIYLDYQRGSTDIGNGTEDTFFSIEKDAFDVDYYTNLYVKLDGDEASLTDEHEDKLKAQEDNMKALAEAVRDGRRESARKEAQDKLDEKKQEYEDNLAEYEQEKKDAEKEIRDAKNQIKKGEKLISSNRKKAKAGKKKASSTLDELEEQLEEVNASIATLKSERKKAEEGLAQATAGKEQAEKGKAELEKAISDLQQAAKADPDNADQYNAQIAELSTQLAGVEQQIAGIDAQIKQINAGIATIDAGLKKARSGKKQLENGIKKAKSGISQADSGLTKLDKSEKELERNKRRLAREERKADREFEKAKKKLDDAKDKLDEAQEKIDDMEIGNPYALSRKENAGYSSFDSNSSIVSNIAKIFPLFFFLIAALVCMTTMTRMVDEQRTQIGVLKALGYSNAQIVGKYMFYSGSAAFLGTLLGFFVGCKVFPAVIWHAYTMMYDFSDTVDYIINYKLGLVCLAVALLCSMGATWVSIAADFKVPPAELIRPKTPPAGKRILLERIRPLWNRISFLYKVSIRNIFRDKKRFLMMVIGVSGCTALLIAGIGIRATISKVADYQFDEISLYDITVIFSKNMTDDRQKDFMEELQAENDISDDDVRFLHRGEVTAVIGDKTTDITCVATDAEGFDEFVDLHTGDQHIGYPGPGEIVIVKKTSHDYGIGVGDKVKLRDGYREMEAKIVGVADNYVYDSLYMTPETYREGFGKEPDIKAAFINFEEDAEEDAIRNASADAAGYENTAAVQTNLDVRENVSKMMKSLNAIVYVVILSAALLAFIVLYNLTNINITERLREIATIKVLGFYNGETCAFVYRENIILTLCGIIAGLGIGVVLHRFVILTIEINKTMFSRDIAWWSYLLAAVLTAEFAAVVNFIMYFKIKKINMVESLKSIE